MIDQEASPPSASPSASARSWGLAVIAAIGAAIGGVELVTGLPLPRPPALLVSLHVAVGWSFIGSGIVALARRPRNTAGILLTGAGFAWFIPALAFGRSPLTNTLSMVGDGLFWAPLAHLLLSFPTGRLTGRMSRFVVLALYGWIPLTNVLRTIFFGVGSSGCSTCPANLLLIRDDPDLYAVMRRIDALGGSVLAIAVLILLVRRWRAASAPQRRVLMPVFWGVWPAFLAALFFVGIDLVGSSPEVAATLLPFAHVAMAVLPVAFLVGLLRARLDRSKVSGLLLELRSPLPHGRLREALADALGDDSLQLAFWLQERGRYVDDRGVPLATPLDDAASGRHVVEIVDSNGDALAALILDQALLQDPTRVKAAANAARLSLDNERLHAELRAQLEEVQASRKRIVDAGDQARRRLERDLHDGAQQRLLAISVALERARARSAPIEDDALRSLLDETTSEIRQALTDLRELARGIHPALLTDEGLGPAIDALARRAAVVARVGSMPTRRLPAAVEVAAYFIVSEALTNAAHHAGDSEVLVDAAIEDGWIRIEVADDGPGGADPDRGTGLKGLHDRVVSLGGTLSLYSPPGGGTRLVAHIPLDQGSDRGETRL